MFGSLKNSKVLPEVQIPATKQVFTSVIRNNLSVLFLKLQNSPPPTFYCGRKAQVVLCDASDDALINSYQLRVVFCRLFGKQSKSLPVPICRRGESTNFSGSKPRKSPSKRSVSDHYITPTPQRSIEHTP